MPKIQCPLDETVSVTFPDEWLMKHVDLFYQGVAAAPVGSAPSTEEIYGAIALCDEIKGIDLSDLHDKPLTLWPMLQWIVKEVYIKSYLVAATVPNE